MSACVLFFPTSKQKNCRKENLQNAHLDVLPCGHFLWGGNSNYCKLVGQRIRKIQLIFFIRAQLVGCVFLRWNLSIRFEFFTQCSVAIRPVLWFVVMSPIERSSQQCTWVCSKCWKCDVKRAICNVFRTKIKEKWSWVWLHWNPIAKNRIGYVNIGVAHRVIVHMLIRVFMFIYVS